MASNIAANWVGKASLEQRALTGALSIEKLVTAVAKLPKQLDTPAVQAVASKIRLREAPANYHYRFFDNLPIDSQAICLTL